MALQKIVVDSPAALSSNLTTDNLATLRHLFPEAVTEGSDGIVLDVDVLRTLVGDKTVTEAEEKYGLSWHGKRRARQMALAPSTGTLRPCLEDSSEWDTTHNLMIEGDNLEVLKLLQKSYAGKVKLIYIDPPYNTGKDFVYKDNFQDNIRNYLQLTGQSEGGKRISSNTETSGRFHTDWLNMMYPRIKLARSLLSDDGVVFVSIDDGELDNLRFIFNEVFGEENFVVQVIWRKRSTPPNDKVIGANHDYILCFAKNLASASLNLRERSQEQIARYQNPDNHPKGPWAPGDLMANVKGGRYVKSLNFPIVNPTTGEEHFPGTNGNYRFSAETITRLISNNEISFGEDGRGKPKLKRFLCDVKDGVTYPSIWDFVPLNTSGSNEMEAIFGNATIFESPKPVGLIQEIVRLGSAKDSIILDFFAGSGTIGHAVMLQNSMDSGTRKFIVVQLPEVVEADSEAFRAGYKTIAELTKERLRRAGKKIRTDNPTADCDFGFRVFRLDCSNIRAWNVSPSDFDASLFSNQDHLLEGRSERDLLYELLLKLGLDLCVPIEERVIAGHVVHSIGGGVLWACLGVQIIGDDVSVLAQGIVDWHKQLAPASDTTCVFRDSAFADDVVKTNMAAILEQNGIPNVRSL